jgi:hypothetical protein
LCNSSASRAIGEGGGSIAWVDAQGVLKVGPESAVKLDNTTLQVLANYCAAAAESMGWTLMRTAHSTFVKETEDFSCQVLPVVMLSYMENQFDPSIAAVSTVQMLIAIVVLLIADRVYGIEKLTS